jgi:hypothetical protein
MDAPIRRGLRHHPNLVGRETRLRVGMDAPIRRGLRPCNEKAYRALYTDVGMDAPIRRGLRHNILHRYNERVDISWNGCPD